MSVLVRDMDFPNHCRDCEFSKPRGNSGTYCSRHPDKEYVEYGNGKPDWCPLGEVVHCKECKWYSDSQHIDNSKMCKLLGVYPAPDGYCYAGKRKEGFYER